MNLIQRPRRLRISSGIRDLVRETELSPRDLVYPIFGFIPFEFHRAPPFYRYSIII